MNRLFEKILQKRGVSSDFLRPKYLSDQQVFSKLPDIQMAVARILEAIHRGEKVMVYGDYDVDGVTATTVMVDALKMAGIKEVTTMLPDRFIDGYGMSERCVERAKAEGVSLVITVDCGSNNSEVISKLAQAKIATIVTDHHEIMAGLPADAVAVVNPKRTDISAAAREEIVSTGLIDLAGVGVAFMVACALVDAGLIPMGQEKWLLDLVLIGTLCDSMRISKLNRELTFYGVKVLEKTRRPGMIELLRVAKVSRISAEAIGFQIGPRLNAGGRMESAEISLNLLMTESKAEAVRLAEELNELNAARKNEQLAAMKEISESHKEALSRPVIVVSGEWHEGVLGIIAGRLVEKYHRPAFVLARVSTADGEIYKGSGRSFGDFNLAEVIKNCPSVQGGGHAAACGVKVLPENLEKFISEVNDYYETLGLSGQEEFLKVLPEFSVEDLADFSEELLDEIATLEPFGEGNAEPIFELCDVVIDEARAVGREGNHLRMVVSDEKNRKMTLVAFSAPEEWLNLTAGILVSVTVQLTRNEWNGRTYVEGRILGVEKKIDI